MGPQVDAGFDDLDAFGFQELFLQRGVGFADQDFAAFAHHAMPRNAFSGGRRSHGSPGAARSTREAQNLSQRPIR
jgi:hypothetical protein